MIVSVAKLAFMKDFSKGVASFFLVKLGKTKGFAEEIILRISADILDNQRY